MTAGSTPGGAKPNDTGTLNVSPDSFGDGGRFVDPGRAGLVGSVATGSYAMLMGASLVRVHGVKATKQAATVVAGER